MWLQGIHNGTHAQPEVDLASGHKILAKRRRQGHTYTPLYCDGVPKKAQSGRARRAASSEP